ncbi:MAG: ribonuclease P protein component [Betaproteobacteria bacterium]|nr:ribonuclease P protein component [Betaproteobacteria bacterium]
MTQGARKEGLSRRHRFVGRGSFAAALRNPRKLRGSMMILHVTSGNAGKSRLGLAVPKRIARRSVDRNRMKRLAREMFRRHDVKALGLDLVLAPREPFSRASEAAWLVDAGQLLDRAAADR